MVRRPRLRLGSAPNAVQRLLWESLHRLLHASAHPRHFSGRDGDCMWKEPHVWPWLLHGKGGRRLAKTSLRKANQKGVLKPVVVVPGFASTGHRSLHRPFVRVIPNRTEPLNRKRLPTVYIRVRTPYESLCVPSLQPMGVPYGLRPFDGFRSIGGFVSFRKVVRPILVWRWRVVFRVRHVACATYAS